MIDFSSSKIIEYRFHVEKNKNESGIGYDMIIGCDLMVQLDLTANFKHQILLWDGATVPTKELTILLGKSYLSKRKMRKMVMNTTEPASTRGST